MRSNSPTKAKGCKREGSVDKRDEGQQLQRSLKTKNPQQSKSKGGKHKIGRDRQRDQG